MRNWFGIGVVLLLACSPDPVTPVPSPQSDVPVAVRSFDQGWTAADRAVFDGTRQGSYLMPRPWFAALRRIDVDAPFAADQLVRYGYLASGPAVAGALVLPVGFVADGTADDPQVGMTCAACHTGQLLIKDVAWRIDGGRSHADFQAFLTDLGQAALATIDDRRRFDAFAAAVLGPVASPAQSDALRLAFADWTRRFTAFMDASLPRPGWGPGRLDAFGMIFNRVTGLDVEVPTNIAKADAPVRYPFIWDAARQDHTQWTGAAPNGTYLRGMARNTGEVFGVFGRLTPTPIPIETAIYDNSVNLAGLQALEEKVVALRPPPWPREIFPLDLAEAARGKLLFADNCGRCHEQKPSPLVSNAWNTVVVDVGTDRRTFDNSKKTASPGLLLNTREPPFIGEQLVQPSPKLSILANAVIGSLLHAALHQDPGLRRAIELDFAEDRLPLQREGLSPAPVASAASVLSATKDLYKLADGIPGAAYEARVLTGIWAVGPYLHNGSVASLWELLRPASARLKSFAVGDRAFDPVNVGLETNSGGSGAVFKVDAGSGNDNRGHEYGTALPEPDRRALLEYLKTL